VKKREFASIAARWERVSPGEKIILIGRTGIPSAKPCPKIATNAPCAMTAHELSRMHEHATEAAGQVALPPRLSVTRPNARVAEPSRGQATRSRDVLILLC
jgi:hypothetical protein